MQQPHFSLSRFGVVNIVDRKQVQPEEPLDFDDDDDEKNAGNDLDHTFSLKPPMEK